MLVRRETAGDVAAVRAVTAAAFARADAPAATPAEVTLLDELRADDGWLPMFSLVAVGTAVGEAVGQADDAQVIGHVLGTRGWVGSAPVLALGPVSVRPDRQRQGVGSALLHAVLGAADAVGEPLVALLGSITYYRRFGFRPAVPYGITPPVAEWGDHFQVRTLAAYEPALRGRFRYPAPFDRV
ncbi:MAG TPA: N-acetyltransferase [Streptosporangiaceae bacterium]